MNAGLVRAYIRELSRARHGVRKDELAFTPAAQDALRLASQQALATDAAYVAPHHMMLALLEQRHDVVAEVVSRSGVDIDRLQELVRKEAVTRSTP